MDAGVRLVTGGPYAGSALLLLAACGLACVPFLPAELETPSRRLAVLPALAVGSFTVLLTTVSVAGVPLTELSIRLAVAALVLILVVASTALRPARESSRLRLPPRREAAVLATLVGLVGFSLASSWDVVYPFQAEGTDWGHYLLYADEVAAQEQLLVDDPFAGEGGRVFADPPAVGALYGSILILDGVPSWPLTAGLVIVSALTVLSVYAAAGALWGAWAGIAASAAYAVAPIRLDPMYWHGLGTTLALVFVPLVVLALGLMYRGRRDWRTIALLGAALASVAASHATSAVVVAVLVALAPIVDVARLIVRGHVAPMRALRSSWDEGLLRPVVLAVVIAGALGAGVIAHLRLQAAELGRPVSYRFLGPDWLDRAAVAGYYSWAFLVVAAVALALVLSSRRLRGDPALLAVLALGLACVLVSQLWRVHVPFEYRRSVYYLGIAMVFVVGAASVRLRRHAAWIGAYALVLAYVAHLSVGLRLPQRVLDFPQPKTPAVSGLTELRDRLDEGRLPETSLVVADSCLHFAVPYLVRKPTLAAFGERQVGFVDRLPLARKAATVIEGGPAGRSLAASMRVGYVVADPRCTPDLAARLGGTVVVSNDELVVVRPAGSS
jgi:hypothetical protein